MSPWCIVAASLTFTRYYFSVCGDVTKWFDIWDLKWIQLLMRLIYSPFTIKLFIHFSECILYWTNGVRSLWENDRVSSSYLHITIGYSLHLLQLWNFYPLTCLWLETVHDESCPLLTRLSSSAVISWRSASVRISYQKIRWSRRCTSTGISAVRLFKMIIYWEAMISNWVALWLLQI